MTRDPPNMDSICMEILMQQHFCVKHYFMLILTVTLREFNLPLWRIWCNGNECIIPFASLRYIFNMVLPTASTFPCCCLPDFQIAYFASVLCMLNASNSLFYWFDYSDISWRGQIKRPLFCSSFFRSSPKIHCKVLYGRSSSRFCLRRSLFAHSALYIYVSVTLQRSALTR
jgi:hypothetical protein